MIINRITRKNDISIEINRWIDGGKKQSSHTQCGPVSP